MAELVDALDLKSSDHCGRAGSSPAPGTEDLEEIRGFFVLIRNDFLLVILFVILFC